MDKSKLNFIVFGTYLTFLSSPGNLFALTWDEVKSAALKNAPSLKTSQLNSSAADEDINATRTSFYPKLSGSATASRTIDQSANQSYNSYTTAISLEQSLYASGRDTAKLNAAIANKDATLSASQAESVATLQKLKKAWDNSIYFRELSKISSSTIERRKANYQIVNLRYLSGRENKGALLKTEASLRQAQVNLEEANSNFVLSRGELSLILGQDLLESEPILGTFLTDTKKPPQNVNATIHPLVRANEFKLKAAEEALQSAKSKYFPEISLTASAKKNAAPDLPLANPVYNAGLTLTIPLFDANTSSGVKSAIINKSIAVITLDETRASHKQSLKSKEAAYLIAKKNLDVSQFGYDASFLQAEVARQRYTLGLVTFQDWDSYENDLIAAELNVLKSQKSVADAFTDFCEALGLTLEESL
jgi:outer membrane protein TolC